MTAPQDRELEMDGATVERIIRDVSEIREDCVAQGEFALKHSFNDGFCLARIEVCDRLIRKLRRVLEWPAPAVEKQYCVDAWCSRLKGHEGHVRPPFHEPAPAAPEREMRRCDARATKWPGGPEGRCTRQSGHSSSHLVQFPPDCDGCGREDVTVGRERGVGPWLCSDCFDKKDAPPGVATDEQIGQALYEALKESYGGELPILKRHWAPVVAKARALLCVLPQAAPASFKGEKPMSDEEIAQALCTVRYGCRQASMDPAWLGVVAKARELLSRDLDVELIAERNALAQENVKLKQQVDDARRRFDEIAEACR